jgi:hypothetical protein
VHVGASDPFHTIVWDLEQSHAQWRDEAIPFRGRIY